MISNHKTAVLENSQPDKKQPEKKEATSISEEDTSFAKERYKLLQSSHEEGVEVDILKKYFSKKYGF